DGGQSGWVIVLTALDSLSRILTAVSYHRTDNTAASFGAGMLVIQLDRFRGALVTHLDTRWANERPHQPLLVLALLLSALSDDPAVDWSAEAATLLRLSKAEQRRIKLMMRYRSVFALDNPGSREMHRFWREFGAAGVDVCLLALADYLGRAGVALDHHAWLALVDRVRVLFLAYFEQYDVLVEPPPLVDGDDLMRALGLPPGAVIGKLLDVIREAQAAGEVTSAAEAIHLAQKHLA
ncbi:MAG: hypothetical protein K8I60_22165, partial [Anaerolineae bacterium]|nr:hypothetical protein [Anaerolineae bacterium]